MSSHVITDVLVTTDWVAQHATDTGTRIVEVDVDTAAYDQGHVPGAAGWNWTTDLCDTRIRDIVPADNLEKLLGRTGIDNDRETQRLRHPSPTKPASAVVKEAAEARLWRRKFRRDGRLAAAPADLDVPQSRSVPPRSGALPTLHPVAHRPKRGSAARRRYRRARAVTYRRTHKA